MMINFLKRKSVEASSASSPQADSINSPQAKYVNYEEEHNPNDTNEYPNVANDFEEELLTSDESPTEEELLTLEDQGTSNVNAETVYKKAVRWLLLIGVALLPLFFLPWTTSVLELNKQLLLVIVAGAGLVLWLLDVVMSGRISWRFNPLDKGVIALAGAVALSAVFSVAKFKSVFGMAGSLSDSLLTVVSLTVVYLLIVNSFDDRGKALRLFFSVSLTVAILYGFLQMLGLHIFSIFRYLGIPVFDSTASRAFNTLGSVNVLGVMSAIALPMLYRANHLSLIINYLLKIGAVVALAVLVVINWWVLWVIAITGMIAVVVLESLSRESRQRNGQARIEGQELGFKMSRFLFPMTVMVLGVFLIVVNLNLVFVKNNLPVELAPSYSLSGNVVWKVLQENFAFGYGPENFSLAFDKYGAGELRNTTLSGVKLFDSTSHVLNMAVHNGLVGLAALGFMLWLLVWSLFRKITDNRQLITNYSESVGVISALVAVIVAMFFYPFNLVLLLTLYVLLALITLAVWGNQRVVYNIEEKASLSLVSSLGFIGGLILALVGLYFMSLNYIADVKYAKALEQTKIQDALNYAVEAINWKENDDRFYRLSSQLALSMLSQELNTKAAPDDTQKNNRIQNYLSSAVALAQRATQVAPNEANNWVNLGNVYQNLMQLVEGTDTLAEMAYLKASELRPGDPSFHNRIGSMYLVRADILRQQQLGPQANAALLKAEDAFRQAIELSSNFGLAIYNLGSVYERQGKINEAVRQLETIAPFNANQPGLAFELGLLYYRANRKDDALAQLQRAVVLSPDYSNARWYLALIYEERKELDQAIGQLERILSIEVNKDNEVVLNKLEELKAGRISIPPARVLDQEPL